MIKRWPDANWMMEEVRADTNTNTIIITNTNNKYKTYTNTDTNTNTCTCTCSSTISNTSTDQEMAGCQLNDGRSPCHPTLPCCSFINLHCAIPQHLLYLNICCSSTFAVLEHLLFLNICCSWTCAVLKNIHRTWDQPLCLSIHCYSRDDSAWPKEISAPLYLADNWLARKSWKGATI